MTRKIKVMLLTVGIIAAVFFSTVQTSLAQENTELPQISMLVVFGGSNVDGGLADPGSLFDQTGGLWPREPHVGGRYTNGPMVAEYLSEKLSAPIRNYAVAWATTGYKNLSDLLMPADAFPGANNTGVLSQIAEYRRDLGGGKADPNALFIYWAAGGDIFGATSEDLNERIAGAAKNIEQGLKELVALGAKRILVALRLARSKLDSEENNFGIRLNDAIAKTVKVAAKSLLFQDVTIELFDAYAITADMKNNPGSYGFSETSAPCRKAPECVENLNVAAAYVQWTGGNVTTKVHQILAENIIQQLKKSSLPTRTTDKQSKGESKPVIEGKLTHESLKNATLSNPHVFTLNSKSRLGKQYSKLDMPKNESIVVLYLNLDVK